MKNLTTAIFSKLAGSALNTAIGGRMYKGRAPDNTVYPYVVFHVISAVPTRTYTEEFHDYIVQFSIFSATPLSTVEIEGIYDTLNILYDEQPMTITGATLLWMRLSNVMPMSEEHTTISGTIEVWHYAVDYDIRTSIN